MLAPFFVKNVACGNTKSVALFGTKGHNGVFAGGTAGGDDARQEGQPHTDQNQHSGYLNGEDGVQVGDVGEGLNDGVDGDA